MNGELKRVSCPFCGDERGYNIVYFGQPATAYAAECVGCGASGPRCESLVSAGEMWHRRPTPAPGALPELPEAYQTVTHINHDGGTRRTFGLHTDDAMHAYARTYAEQCRAGVVVTDAMVERAMRAHLFVLQQNWRPETNASTVNASAMRAALHSAFADDEGVEREG